MQANRDVDTYAIQERGISGIELMDAAGRAVVLEMLDADLLQQGSKILVLSGKGNNGGDGFVIARDLHKRGFEVALFCVSPVQAFIGDALHHLHALLELGALFELWTGAAEQLEQLGAADVIVDALLGTGVTGELRAPYDDLIRRINASPARIVSVDVPSGVSGDIGNILSECVRADLTVSMGFGKLGCLFEPARSMCGKLRIVDIGFPAESLAHVEAIALRRIEHGDFPPQDYTRSALAHKYTAGKVLIIAGSKSYSGAAILAARAAIRSGAGLVKLAVPEGIADIVAVASPETILLRLPQTQSGGLGADPGAELKAALEWADTVALGPGLGRDPETITLCHFVIKETTTQLVLDADALFALSLAPELLKRCQAPLILTPHLGEFRQLIAWEEKEGPGWQEASRFAQANGCHVLLKGSPSILAHPDGDIAVNSTGYAGMATAGSGDVLSGVMASLWSQFPGRSSTLEMGMYMHGLAADSRREEKGVLGLIASDIIEALPQVLKEYGEIQN